jgi:hypothetical protein
VTRHWTSEPARQFDSINGKIKDGATPHKGDGRVERRFMPGLAHFQKPNEFPNTAEVIARFGLLKRALALVKRVTGTDEWESVTRRSS